MIMWVMSDRALGVCEIVPTGHSFYDYDSKQKFDAIVLMGVIEHLPDYERVLKKVDHLLKPGGFVFLDGSATRKKYELSTFMVRHIYPGNHSCLVLDDLLHKLARKTELELPL
jgi:cyclopropane-fatty-acyl-phospholipid synthase